MLKRFGCGFVLAAAFYCCAPVLASTPTLFLNFDGDTMTAFGPLKKFDAHDLKSSWGATETNQLRGGILADVVHDYREFNLNVTDVRPASEPYYTVGIEGVAVSNGTGTTFGTSLLDYRQGRVYAKSNTVYPEFQGANATVARFRTGLAGTTAHEAGHLFGLFHMDAKPSGPEVALGRMAYHDLMATPELNQINMEQRATVNRNFGAVEYGKLAAFLGLNTQTLANWNFRNPNSTDANDFHIKFLSQHSSLTVQSEYSHDPFGTPTLSRSSVTTDVGGDPYYEYELTWSGGAGVPAGGAFHTGISFAESNDFIVRDTFLTKDGVQLDLRPRLPSVTGDPKPDGSYALHLANSSDAPMTLSNLRVRYLSMMADLETLLPAMIEEPLTSDGEPIPVIADLRFNDPFELPAGGEAEVVIDSFDSWLARNQHPPGSSGGAASILNGELFDGFPVDPDDEVSFVLGMFPSAYLYVTADAVLPNQLVFNPATGGFDMQDLVSEVFVQFAGVSRTIKVPESSCGALLAAAIVAAVMRRRAHRAPSRVAVRMLRSRGPRHSRLHNESVS